MDALASRLAIARATGTGHTMDASATVDDGALTAAVREAAGDDGPRPGLQAPEGSARLAQAPAEHMGVLLDWR
ncbi:MAG: hypothetical protein M3442_08110 [Chloroflexota bacterium]|nr:hypothetical protein [Chloroflexota bacterium]